MTEVIKDQNSSKKNRDDKGRKKDEKSLELIMKSLNSLPTPEEKFDAMCKKYSEIQEENRKLSTNAKQLDKKCISIQKEKEQLQIEFNKTVLTKSKLESLCRELQRQNKAIKDESLLKIREEEERRKETQAKFQATLAEITTLMQQNNDKSNKLRDDNLDMTKKFQTIVEQYEIREQQVEKMAKQMDLQNKLAEAKLAKARTEAMAEKEIALQEKQQLLIELKSYQNKLKEKETLENALRAQVAMYTDKYDEFQNSLQRSNQVFGGFKEEMEKMSKKIVKLEKETLSWKQRWENSQTALLNMASEKQKQVGDLSLAQRQLQQLQKLCRTLQNERSVYIATLKAKGIERPVIPEPEPEPVIELKSDDTKLDQMALNCRELKQNLAELQGQLSSITSTNKNEKKSEKRNKKKKNTNSENTAKENAEKFETVETQDNSQASSEVQTLANSNETCGDNENISADSEKSSINKPIETSNNTGDGTHLNQIVETPNSTTNVETISA